MGEISENLHRAELTVLQRSEQVAKWVELAGRVSAQVGKKSPGRPESGQRKAARELNLGKDEVHRATKIASLPEEAKEAAKDAHLLAKAPFLTPIADCNLGSSLCFARKYLAIGSVVIFTVLGVERRDVYSHIRKAYAIPVQSIGLAVTTLGHPKCDSHQANVHLQSKYEHFNTSAQVLWQPAFASQVQAFALRLQH